MMKTKKVICSYCNKPSKLVTGTEIYPFRKDLYKKYFYLCRDCEAYVGCHPNTSIPLGRLANKELRAAKRAAHAVFDKMYEHQKNKRSAAYIWLAAKLNIPEKYCHIGMFDVATCKKVIEIVSCELKQKE